MSATSTPVRTAEPGTTRELGVRRTVPGPRADVWQRLLGEWLPTWLGADSVPLMVGAPLRDGEREVGVVIGCHVGRRVRIRWDSPAIGHETLFQVSLLDEEGSTSVVIRQELLDGADERRDLLARWTAALEDARSELLAEDEERRSSDPRG